MGLEGINLRYAFISDGRLFLCDDDSSIKEIESKFASERMNRVEQTKSRQSWKSREETASGPFSSGMIWGKQASIAPYVKFKFINVGFEDQNTLYYLLSNNLVTGLFKYTIDKNYEQRLFHKQNIVVHGVDYSAALEKFVISTAAEDGSTGLTLLDEQGSYQQALTGGDSRDSNPYISRQTTDKILYQSAGIVRDDNGVILSYGPEFISSINLKTGEISEVLSDCKYDYLLPKDDSAGNLYCIRRPYIRPGYQPVWKTMWYIVTFPVRFVVALVKFLDAFTRLFYQQPFQPAGPAIEAPVKNKYLNVLGRTINLAKIQKSLRKPDDPSLVPRSWELIRMSKDGDEVISRKVSSYDIDADNKVHITNGFRVNAIEAGRAGIAFKYNLIENIKVIKTPAL
jgi:hypothetical protein